MEDEPWIAKLIATKKDWTVLTMDQMRRERHAVHRSGFTWFLFWSGWPNLSLWEQARRLMTVWPDLVELGLENPGLVLQSPLTAQ